MRYYILISNASPKGESGEPCGSKYDLSNACKHCGTGAKLQGNLLAKGLNKIKENLFFTLDDDLLISKELYNTLVENQVKLNDIANVVDVNGYALPFYHLNPTLSFPKMLPQSQGLKIEDQCTTCCQNGYFNDVIVGDLDSNISTYIAPLVFHYANITSDFLSQSDMFHTWEHMGLSNISAGKNKVIRYARPLLIVNENIKSTFDSFKIKKLSFKEVIMRRSEFQ